MKKITTIVGTATVGFGIIGGLFGGGTAIAATGDADGLHTQYRNVTITFPDKLTVSGGVPSAGAGIVLDTGNKFSPAPICPGVLAGTTALDGYYNTTMCG